MSKFLVVGGENNGGVRNYMLYVAENLTEHSFQILSHNSSYSPIINNVSYVNVKGNRISILFSIIRLVKKENLIIIANTISSGFIVLIVNLLFSVEYFFIGHTIRSLQISRFSWKFSFIKFVEFLVYSNSKCNIAICKSEYEYLSSKFKNSRLIPTKFNFKFQFKKITNPWCFKKVIYNLASVDERKNPKMFIEIAQLCSMYDDIVFVWFGDGPLLKAVQEIVKLNNLKNVFFEGSKPHIDILNLIPDFHCMLMTSEVEGVPISIIESLNLGIPVITFNYSGCKPFDIIKNGYNGFVYNSINEASDYIAYMVNNQNYKVIKENLINSSVKSYLESEEFIKNYKNVFKS